MEGEKVYKKDPSRLSRLLRLLGATFDPRALAHVFRLINYYNYTHVAELRKATVGRDVRISPNASFANGANIVLGDRVRIGAHVSLWAGPGRGRIVLGDDTIIAPGVMLTASNYRFDDGSPVTKQAMEEADIIIGVDVWIGYGAVILPGVRIGDRAIIGAGAVVRSDVPNNGIVAGNPGKVMGMRRGAQALAATQALINPVNPGILDLIRAELPRISEPQLPLAFNQAGVDSFDLITLRTALEAATRLTLPDQEWAAITSLEDVAKLASFAGWAGPAKPMPPVAAKQPDTPAHSATVPPATSQITGKSNRTYLLNMPQMALSGLSESWLFKEIGDIHWGMITHYLQSPSSAITDDMGDRLYATFTRIMLTASPSLRGFRENQAFDINSGLERYGASFFFGSHQITGPQGSCTATTMSTFAKYGERGENTSLIKGTPMLPVPDGLPSIAGFPEFGTEYRTRRAAEPGPAIFSCDYEILPPHDINGVGLLYFAAYPMIFDLCFERSEGKGFLIGTSTVSKDICYFANSEPTETLRFDLHLRGEADGKIRHVASLSRTSDGKRMAEIISVKQRVEKLIL